MEISIFGKLVCEDCVGGNVGFCFSLCASSQNYPQHQKGEEHRKENYLNNRSIKEDKK